MTALQRHILGYLCARALVDPDGGEPRAAGATAADLAGSECLGGFTYGRPTVVRCLNAMCRSTSGNADHEPRPAWVRQVHAPDVPTAGPGRQWVATSAGAAALGSETHA